MKFTRGAPSLDCFVCESGSAANTTSLEIRNAHDNVGANFRDGRSLEETVGKIFSGSLRAEDFPPINAVLHDNAFWSLGKRRCWCLKESQRRLKERGHCTRLYVRLRILPAAALPHKFITSWTALRSGVQNPGFSVPVGGARYEAKVPELMGWSMALTFEETQQQNHQQQKQHMQQH